MIPTHRAKPNTEPISIPAIAPGGAIWLFFSVLPVNTSGCVCLINSTAVIVFISISSFPRFGGKFGPQSSDPANFIPKHELPLMEPQLIGLYRLNMSKEINCGVICDLLSGINGEGRASKGRQSH